MFDRLPRFLPRLATAALAALFAAASASAAKPGFVQSSTRVAPLVTTIGGTPLTVNVGDDLSFQVRNSAIPGVGQIYPPASTDTADMGWMVHVVTTTGHDQYAPDFSDHSDGSATGNLGTRLSYISRSVSAVSGAGTSASPFQVTTTGTLGSSGLRAVQTVRYVNGQNYFTKTLTLNNQGSAPSNVKIFLGADIYLAGADSGVPYRNVAANAVGGSDCGATPSYYILLIPQTPADAWTGNSYSSIWSQIGAGALDNALASGCIDNAAALQWNRTIAAGASVTVQAVTSFGDIPSIAQFNITSVTPPSGAQGTTVNVTITGVGFDASTTFTFGAGITVGNVVIVDGNTATATLTIAPAATPGPRDVGGSNGTLSATLSNGFTVTAGAGPGPGAGPVAAPTLDVFGMLALLLMLGAAGMLVLRRH